LFLIGKVSAVGFVEGRQTFPMRASAFRIPIPKNGINADSKAVNQKCFLHTHKQEL
jgi:hypothetical protein